MYTSRSTKLIYIFITHRRSRYIRRIFLAPFAFPLIVSYDRESRTFRNITQQRFSIMLFFYM